MGLSDTLFTILFIVFALSAFMLPPLLIGLVAAAWRYWALSVERDKVYQQQEALARALGYKHHPFKSTGIFKARGPIKGRNGDFDSIVYLLSHFKGKTTSVVDTYFHAPLEPHFEVLSKNWITRTAHVINADSIPTGDEDFDKHYFVKGGDMAQVLKLLTPATRQKLIALNKLAAGTQVNSNGVRQRFHKRFTDASEVQTLLALQLEVARAIMSAAELNDLLPAHRDEAAPAEARAAVGVTQKS